MFAVQQFESGNTNLKYEWGSHIGEFIGETFGGIFLRLHDIPINPPWQLPATWNELYTAGLLQGLDIKKDLEDTYIRYGKRSITFVALGFPVSEKNGGPSSMLGWLFIGVREIKTNAGFRNDPLLFEHNARILFAAAEKINWIEGENWNKKQITSRGLLDLEIQKQKILLIGAGAVGSVISELLVRMGCANMTIVDNDVAKMGNFSRHTLKMTDIVHYKAHCLATRFNAIFPFATIDFENKKIHEIIREEAGFLKKYDLIVDASASDEVIHLISESIDTQKNFDSLSIGINGKRLFCYLYRNSCEINLETDFHSKLSPWLLKEKEENVDLKLKPEGIGCWHPVFPARIDDINMLVSTAIKIIESDLRDDSVFGLKVIQKRMVNNIFTGIDILGEKFNT